MLSQDGGIKEVLWEGPAFRAGLTAGSKLLGVNGRAYGAVELKAAIAAAAHGQPIELTVETGKRTREVTSSAHAATAIRTWSRKRTARACSTTSWRR